MRRGLRNAELWHTSSVKWAATLVTAAFLAAAAQTLPALGATAHSTAAHRVTASYLLRGRLTAFVPARGAVDGSVSIRLGWGTNPRWLEPGEILTFRVTASTVVTSGPSGVLHAGDRAVVKVPAVFGAQRSVRQLESHPADAITVVGRSVMEPMIRRLPVR
jgi:hypothetical protein